jgi:multidrug efflux pump subunit AcrA (membrane-fusion protein)
VPVKRGDFVHTGDVVARLEFSVEEVAVALGRAQAAATEEIDAQKTRLAVGPAAPTGLIVVCP